MITRCTGCHARWSGFRPAHCGTGGCHLTFSGATAFDLHRHRGECLNPRKVNLIEQPNPQGGVLWGWPGDWDGPSRRPTEPVA